MTPRTVAHQAPLSIEFSRQEYWSGLPFPFSGDFPDLGIEPESPALQADSLLSEPPGEGCTQNSTPFKTYNLFISGIFHLIFSHYASLRETKTAEKKTAGTG